MCSCHNVEGGYRNFHAEIASLAEFQVENEKTKEACNDEEIGKLVLEHFQNQHIFCNNNVLNLIGKDTNCYLQKNKQSNGISVSSCVCDPTNYYVKNLQGKFFFHKMILYHLTNQNQTKLRH